MRCWCLIPFISFTVATAQAAGERAVGVETIHSDSESLVTIYVPLPSAGGRLFDLNAFDFNQAWPERFWLSDGSLENAFILVDLRSGGPLDLQVAALTQQVLQAGGDPIETLRTFMGTKLAPAPVGFHAGLPANWITPPPPPEFAQAANLSVGAYPIATSLQQPGMALEDFLAIGAGNCVPKALFTSLILHRLGWANRVRAGASQASGHMWVELPDGRHLDPTWEVVGTVDTVGAWPGWIHFSSSYLFIDAVYPIAVDP